MNASGVSKACKSNGSPEPARAKEDSGKRERNTLATYPGVVNNPWKRGLIRDIQGGSSDIPLENSGAPGWA